MQTEKRQHLALDAIVSYMKLEITLASGTIILSATFLENIYQGQLTWSIIVAWALLGLSIICGFLVSGDHIRKLIEGKIQIKRGERIEWLALFQTVFLLAGFAFFAAFATYNVTAGS